MIWNRKENTEFRIGAGELVARNQERDFLLAFPETVVESVRQMLVRVGRGHELPRRLAITSALREEGVTYLTRAVGAVLAHDLAAPVCVVELNWWRPAPLPDDSLGLAGVLNGQAALDEALVATGWPQLVLLPAGEVPPLQRHAAVHQESLPDVFNQLEETFDYLILDIPAILGNSSAVPMAALAGDVVVVVRQGVTRIEQVGTALDDIQHLNILGVVMNDARLETPERISRLLP